MIGILGKILIILAFLSSIAAIVFYFLDSKHPKARYSNLGHAFFIAKGLFITVASGLLLYLLFTHQFQYYYVYNYTSLDLSATYLAAAYYSGQEGSFMLWILMSFLVGLALIKWTSPVYRSPMMFFFSITQFFLLMMILGVDIAGLHLGASPFRTLQEQMPNLPVWQVNPDFVPADGSGLNDLLRSPWIVIHPPFIFVGFAMMTIPYAFALAALWRRAYQDWIYPALPWALGANLSLLIAIFLGGYWAYETLSFGGYWAWDPVENASLVPWIVGVAGIHTMLVQRRSASSKKASLIFAILAYILVVYQTFLTRSGVLGDSSVHSFVDLGLYSQLLLFMVTMIVIAVVLFVMRFREMPSQEREDPILSKEFLMFSGALVLFLTGLVIILGTSSPIIGRLFVDHPTPPEMSFYNDWSIPFAILISVMTVVTQYLWWRKIGNAEQLASQLIGPTLLTAVVTIATIIFADVRNPIFMLYLMAGYFALIGNGWLMVRILQKKPRMAGGTLTHVGFAVMLLGFMGAAYDRPMLDEETKRYNEAVLRGDVVDDEGFPVVQTINMIELFKGEPKLVDDRYLITFVQSEITERDRPGEQEYTLRIEDTRRNNRSFYIYPVLYPMLANSTGGDVSWTVDPHVEMGIFSDMYAYVAGSYLVDREFDNWTQGVFNPVSQPVSDGLPVPESDMIQTVKVKRGASVSVDNYKLSFADFEFLGTDEYPENATIAVRAQLTLTNLADSVSIPVAPTFAIVRENDENVTFAPQVAIGDTPISVRFINVNPGTEEIELELSGIRQVEQKEWILLTVEKKPFVSVVWLGTILLMIGFSFSIMRRWSDQKRRELREKKGEDQLDENEAYA
ncbi:MAG: cytochrome c-type biogenesis protein CcmF [Bacteroidetes bacterium HLUCCA01]|nr:MAG: cytochrome c-type biogenesis protein CcmF [Bacteroidetes bacterium HLUCCA01]